MPNWFKAYWAKRKAEKNHKKRMERIERRAKVMSEERVPPLVPSKASPQTPTKPITQSRTTAAVATSGVLTVGGVLGVLAFIRSAYPDVIPWPPERDEWVAGFVIVVLVPVISRWLKPLIVKISGKDK